MWSFYKDVYMVHNCKYFYQFNNVKNGCVNSWGGGATSQNLQDADGN